MEFTFERGVKALLMIAGCVDWAKSVEQLTTSLAARRASALVRATYGRGWDKQNAARELADMDRASTSEQAATEVAA